MKTILRKIGVVSGMVISFGSAIASFLGAPIIGLRWEIYAFIGISILIIAGIITFHSLESKIKKFNSNEAKLQREKLELEVEQLKSQRIDVQCIVPEEKKE